MTVPGDVLGGFISPQHALGSPLACCVPRDIRPLKPVFGLFCPRAQSPGTRSFWRVGLLLLFLPFLGTHLACPDPLHEPPGHSAPYPLVHRHPGPPQARRLGVLWCFGGGGNRSC